jgi:hypothetical protein
MAKPSQPDSSNSFPGTGSLVGLLFTGAMLGVGIFAAVVAAFDTIRDKNDMHWGAELVTFALICFLFALLATALGCYLFARLITAIAGQAAATSCKVPEQVQPVQQAPVDAA